ncbi:MAG TPA: ABC transporter permease [Thermoanaerobaculia bacterium]|jgi:putative ABC transport system permease protein|nr:ABC transporter permease [Thermoanaerobaculia bacterium]
MGSLLSDLAYSLRVLGRARGFLAAAVATLALGIGANTAVFSVVEAVLLRALPYPDPDRLVWVWEDNAQQGLAGFSVAPAKYLDWRSSARGFSAFAALRDVSSNLDGPEGPVRVQGLQVSASFFRLLGAGPVLGRAFLPDEDRPGAARVAVLSHRLWQEQFGGAPDVVGQQMELKGETYTVVGVMGPGFAFPSRDTALWVPLALSPGERSARDAHTLRVLARIKPGTTVAQAKAEMAAVSGRFAREHPETDAGWSVSLVTMRDQAAGDLRRPLAVLTTAVALLLLIACANVASLLLARASNRAREISIRTALGASRWRLVRQFLTESLVVGLAGGLAGVALGYAGLRLLALALPPRYLGVQDLALDGRVLLFTFGLSLATGLVSGLLPAFHTSRPDLGSLLRQGGRSAAGGRRHVGQRLLVVAETVLAFVLLAGAGLLLKSFGRLAATDPGFRPDHVLTMQLALSEAKYSGDRLVAFYDRLLARVREVPGVTRAALGQPLPLSGSDPLLAFTIEGRPVREGEEPAARYRAVSPRYFEVLGIPLDSGRDFTPFDDGDAPGVVVVNRTMARRFWPDESPIGKRIQPLFPNNRICTVIGVSGDVLHTGLDSEPQPEMYYPYPQIPQEVSSMVAGTVFLAVRTQGEPEALAGAVRRAVLDLDPAQPVFNVRSLDRLVESSLADRRFALRLLSTFAVLGIALAGLGLYGVLSYLTALRRKEIGLRMALGADRGRVFRLLLADGLLLAGTGLLAGWLAATAATRSLAGLLYRVSATDPAVFAAAAALLLAVAAAAVSLPATSALRVDPAVTLRRE